MDQGRTNFLGDFMSSLQPESSTAPAEAASAPESAAPAVENGEIPQQDPQEAAEPAAEAPAADPIEAKLADVESRFAKLSAASAKVQADRKALAAEREAQKAEWEEYQQYKKAKELAQEDPEGWARLGGFKRADEFAAKLIDKGTLTPERRKVLELEQKTRKQEEWIQTYEQKQAEAARQAAEAEDLKIIQEFGQQEEMAERFDLVNRFNAHNLVINEIKAHYQKTAETYGEGEILDLEEAYARVEDRLDKEIAPALESPKYRKKFGQAAPAATAPSTPASMLAPRKPQGKTVTGQTRAQSAPPRQLSEEERLQEAYNVFFGKI